LGTVPDTFTAADDVLITVPLLLSVAELHQLIDGEVDSPSIT
jgi:hypothetical protein